ncbi:MAG: superoxide dismutase family protein [Oscillospiraceae bacterium]
MNRLIFGFPAAMARIHGGIDNPGISGTVYFFNRGVGTLVLADINGLPRGEGPCASRVFGFHIHEGRRCDLPDFESAGGHFNPEGCMHPYHAGDLPPLFEWNGRAYMAVLTGRFSVSDIVGRTVIIHSAPDNFRTQPSGDSGSRIACGVIRRVGA